MAKDRARGLDVNPSWSLGGPPAPSTTLCLWPSRPNPHCPGGQQEGCSRGVVGSSDKAQTFGNPKVAYCFPLLCPDPHNLLTVA